MRCFECRYLDRSEVLTCYPPKYYCTYDKTTHFADDECKYEHYPIVRCKDCRHSRIYQTDSEGTMQTYCVAFVMSRTVTDDGFCSWGERREP